MEGSERAPLGGAWSPVKINPLYTERVIHKESWKLNAVSLSSPQNKLF